jgi:hypothetical protein
VVALIAMEDRYISFLAGTPAEWVELFCIYDLSLFPLDLISPPTNGCPHQCSEKYDLSPQVCAMV